MYVVFVIRQIFIMLMKYRLQSMYNHMVGRTASVLIHTPWVTQTHIEKDLRNDCTEFPRQLQATRCPKKHEKQFEHRLGSLKYLKC